jgi:hypothetical protein
LSFDYINQIVDNPIFQTQDGIQVPQANICINNGYLLPLHRECATQVRCRRRFANTTLP